MTILNFIPKVWSAALLEAFHASSVVIPTFNTDYEGTVKAGNAVNITTVTTPTIVNYATNRTITPEALNDTTQQLPINQEKAYAFLVDDVDRVQAAGSFDAVTRDAGAALLEDSESYAIAQMLSGGTVANPQTASGVLINSPDRAFGAVNTLRLQLGKAKTPAANRYLAVNPEFSFYLLDENSKLTDVNRSGSNESLRNGVLGDLLGFTVVESPLLNPGTPTAIGYSRTAVSWVGQLDKTESLRDTNSFSDIVRALMVYGSKVTRPTSCQVFKSSALGAV